MRFHITSSSEMFVGKDFPTMVNRDVDVDVDAARAADVVGH